MRKSKRRKRSQSAYRKTKRTIRRKQTKRSKRKIQKLKSKKKSSAKKGGMYSDIPEYPRLIFAKVRLAMALALSKEGLTGDVIEMVNDHLKLGGNYQGITIIFMGKTGENHEITLPRTLSSSLVRMKHLKDILKENFVKKNVELRLVDTDTCQRVSDDDETLIYPGRKEIHFQEVTNEMKNLAKMEADCEKRKLE